MNFEQAHAEYQRLRQAYDRGALPPEDYTRQVQALQVRDTSGAYWAVDGATGGWLRYDGAQWVPAQPPAREFAGPAPASVASPQPQPQAQPQPDSPLGQSQPAGYETSVPAAPVALAAQPKRSRRPLLFGCLAVALLGLLLACVGAVVVYRSLDRTTGIVKIATAPTIDARNQPVGATNEFPVNTEMYVTFTTKGLKKGQKVTMKGTRNGTPIEFRGGSNVHVLEQEGTVYSGFSYKPPIKGDYTISLYLDEETEPRQTATFTVK